MYTRTHTRTYICANVHTFEQGCVIGVMCLCYVFMVTDYNANNEKEGYKSNMRQREYDCLNKKKTCVSMYCLTQFTLRVCFRNNILPKQQGMPS